MAANLGEGQLRFETHECQVCWTGSTCDPGSGQVLWTYAGWKTLPPSTSLPVMGEIAGVNTASLGGYLHSTKTRASLAEGFHVLNGYVFDLGRDGLRQVLLCPRLTMRRQHTTIPYRIGRPRVNKDTRTEVSSVLLVHHRRFEAETTSPSDLEHKDTKICSETSGTNT